MSQIISITSEALQATVRRLLPSQQGFGEDLQASNVILPVIDLTPTAEGSQLQQNFAEAWSLNSNTNWNATNTTVTIANSPGFYRVWGVACVHTDSAANTTAQIDLTDGLTSKTLWKLRMHIRSADLVTSEQFDTIVFLDTGESITGESNGVNAQFEGNVRQVADRYGNIVNPSGFTFE